MTDTKQILAFERKLQQLKEEESQILKLLQDVRKQLKKYELATMDFFKAKQNIELPVPVKGIHTVEELQTCNESIANKNGEESDSDESVIGDNEMLLQIIDSAQIINNSTLDLGIRKILREESDEESEESEESD